MTVFRVLTLLACLTTCSALPRLDLPKENLLSLVDYALTADWLLFKHLFNKTYSDNTEELKRRLIWQDARKFIDDHNKLFELGETTFLLGENDLTDLTDAEVRKFFLSEIILPDDENENEESEENEENMDDADEDFDDMDENDIDESNETDDMQEDSDKQDDDLSLPRTVDWVSRGKVTPVKSQGRCGSCWAFAALGALESAYLIRHNKQTDLSEQNLVDCAASNFNNWGCRGGWMGNAYKYIMTTGGVDSERCYPYDGRDLYCRFKKRCIAGRIKSYHKVPKGEGSMKKVVARTGPVAIAVDVNSPYFWRYRSGVFNNPGCNRIRPNHAMVAVGYGYEGGRAYWKVKNSWGQRWGDHGYIKMSRNAGDQCGISSFAVYPMV